MHFCWWASGKSYHLNGGIYTGPIALIGEGPVERVSEPVLRWAMERVIGQVLKMDVGQMLKVAKGVSRRKRVARWTGQGYFGVGIMPL